MLLLLGSTANADYDPNLPAMRSLPVGTVLLLQTPLTPMPSEWVSCGYVRVEQGEKKADHELICIRKIS